MAAELLVRVCAEIEARMAELRPAVAEYERLLGAAGALEQEAQAPARPPRARGGARPRAATGSRAARGPRAAARPRRAARPRQGRLGASEQAIVAALEHGSHTVGELVVVTALAGGEIRGSVSRLLKAGRIARARREGRSAYALAETA